MDSPTRRSNLRRLPTRSARVLYNALVDLRFGAVLAGRQESRLVHLGAHAVENSDYRALDRIFGGRIRPGDVLVDVGCGRGRVINWWLANGYADHRLIGIEIDPDVAATTRRRLAGRPNVEIVSGDIVDAFPADGTLFYLYNPFQRHVVEQFAAAASRAAANGADMRILYSNCKHADVFADDPRWQVEIVDIGGGVVPFDPVAVITPSPAPPRAERR